MENKKYTVVKTKGNNSKYIAVECEISKEIIRHFNKQVNYMYEVICDGEKYIIRNIYDSLEEAQIVADKSNKLDKGFHSITTLADTYESKYSTLPLFECDNDNNYVFQGYIASICFIIDEVYINYKTDDGKIVRIKDYNVVFPYNDIKTFKENLYKNGSIDLGKVRFPEYLKNGNIVNAYSTSNIFDTYEEAKQKAKIYNEYYIETEAEKQNKPVEEVRKKVSNDLIMCDLYEDEIRKIVITNKKDLNNKSSVKKLKI